MPKVCAGTRGCAQEFGPRSHVNVTPAWLVSARGLRLPGFAISGDRYAKLVSQRGELIVARTENPLRSYMWRFGQSGEIKSNKRRRSEEELKERGVQ